MRYEPRKRSFRMTWKLGVLFVCVAVLISFLLIHFLRQPEIQGSFHACNFSNSEMKDLQDQSTNVIELEDYLFYGESLGFIYGSL